MPAHVEDLPQLQPKLAAMRQANLRHHSECIAQAARSGASCIGLGELFSAPYFALGEHAMWRDLAEDARTGPSICAMQEAARANRILVVAPIYEADADLRFNTAVVIENDGTILGKYRKTHIPAGRNDQGSFHETFYYQASDGRLGASDANISSNPFFPVFETSIGKLGIAICYDRHFPGVMQTLASQGAQLVLSPAITFGSTSQHMWELEFEVDALRHNIFIAGSNRKGQEAPWNQPYFGASYVAGPKGRVATQKLGNDLLLAEVLLEDLQAPTSSGWDLSRDVRPSIYDFTTSKK